MTISLSDSQFLFLDCQTTGASPRLGNLLEVAYCKGNAHGLVSAKSYLIVQDVAIPARISDLTGITDDDLIAHAISAQSICQRMLLDMTSDTQIVGCVIHYAKFEKPFLTKLFEDHASLGEIPKPIVCTHEIAKRLYPDLSLKGIRALHGYFGGHAINFKRAVCHAEATHFIWSRMIADLSRLGIDCFDDLVGWLGGHPIAPSRQENDLAANRTGCALQDSVGGKHHVQDGERLSLPDRPGVYRMLNSHGDILYVGKATSLKSRVNSYFRGQTKKDLKTREMLLQTFNIHVTECLTALDAAIFESDEIKRLAPPYNISLKKGRRQILFYSRDFALHAPLCDEKYSIGPFAGERVLEPLQLICQGARDGVFNERIFLGMVLAEDIKAGFEIFRSRFGLHDDTIFSVRNLIAIGTKIARQSKLSIQLNVQREKMDEAATLEDDLSGAALDDIEEELEAEPTPEDFADAIEKLLRRSAIHYSRAKALRQLSDSEISYREKKRGYILRISGGEIGVSVLSEPEFDTDQIRPTAQKPWTVEKYDRLRVLLSELIRLRNRGTQLSTKPALRFFAG